jgi:hypothetical protein
MHVITRYRGDSYPIEVTLTKNEAPVDLSSQNTHAKFSFTKGKLRHVIVGVNGNANGEISFPFPKDVAAGEYTYDIEVVNPVGEVRTFIVDKLIIEDEVS